LRKLQKTCYIKQMNTTPPGDESTPIADNAPGERTMSGQAKISEK
jgi:hypothetical protein